MNEFFAFLTGLIGLVIPGFGAAQAPSWNGYVEADYLYVASATPGQIEDMVASEGQVVKAGDVLFTLKHGQQDALLAAAEAQAKAAEANLTNLETGSRSDEVAVIRATLDKAMADSSLTATNLARSQKLFAQGLIPQSKLDQDLALRTSAQAQVTQLEAQLRVASLPARDAQQLAAEANLAAARANAEKAKADLADRTFAAPADGRINRLFFAKGEMAGTGVPVVSLLRAGALKIKFYVGEAERGDLAIGEDLAVSCEGCPEGLTAKISYFASDPQFTPPIIYSHDERTRLVFLVEATLAHLNDVLPGQPVSVSVMK